MIDPNWQPKPVFSIGAQTQAYVPPAAKKPNFWESLLPSGGGLVGGVGGGALGGALAGTAILPGIGTAAGGLLGALLGGAAGGAAGKVAENKITGQNAWHDVPKEAAIQGVLSAGPLRLLKGVGEAGNVAINGAEAATTAAGREAASQLADQGAGKLTQALTAGGEKAAAPGLIGRALSRGSEDLQAGVTGVGKVTDSFTQQQRVLDTLNRRGLSGSGAKLYQSVDGEIGNLSNEIADKLATIDATAPRDTVINSLKGAVTDSVPADTSYAREIGRSIDRLAKTGEGDVTPQQLFEFKQQLSDQLGNAFKKMDRGAPLTVKEEVDMALWKNIDKQITNMAPEVKQLTLDQSNLITARPGFKAMSEKTLGVPLLGIKSKAAERALQTGQSAASRAGGALGNIAPYGALGIASRVLPAGLAGALAGTQGQKNPMMDSTTIPDTTQSINDNITPSSANSLNSSIQTNSEQTGQGASPFDPANVQANIQKILANGGKMKDVTDYVSLVDAIQGIQANATKAQAAPTLSTAAQARSDALQTALSSLDAAESNLVTSGGAKGPLVGAAATAPVIGQLLDPAGASYHNTKIELATQLAKAITGGSRAPENIIQQYLHSLPDVNDTPEYAAAKIAKLRSELLKQAQSFGFDNLTQAYAQ